MNIKSLIDARLKAVPLSNPHCTQPARQDTELALEQLTRAAGLSLRTGLRAGCDCEDGCRGCRYRIDCISSCSVG